MPRNRVSLSAPPSLIREIASPEWLTWFNEVHNRVGDGPFLIPGYDVESLPDPAEWATKEGANPFSSLVYGVDSEGNSTIYYSTGNTWLALTGNNTVYVSEVSEGNSEVPDGVSLVLANSQNGPKTIIVKGVPSVNTITVKKVSTDTNTVTIQTDDGTFIDGGPNVKMKYYRTALSLSRAGGQLRVI